MKNNPTLEEALSTWCVVEVLDGDNKWSKAIDMPQFKLNKEDYIRNAFLHKRKVRIRSFIFSLLSQLAR